MFGLVKKIFGGSDESLIHSIARGARLIDVRSKAEFATGSVPGAINIPVDQLAGSVSQLKKYPEIVVFCRSGMRSAGAKNILEQHGVRGVRNGGSWTAVHQAWQMAQNAGKV